MFGMFSPMLPWQEKVTLLEAIQSPLTNRGQMHTEQIEKEAPPAQTWGLIRRISSGCYKPGCGLHYQDHLKCRE